MSRLGKALGRNRDLPQLESVSVITDAAATDYEYVIATVPNLASIAPSGTAGQQAINSMVVREIYFTFSAALTGAATNNVAYNINQKRAGAALVNTTATTAVAAAGLATITPASMANITVGLYINVSGGTGTAEQIVVSAVTATTFSAVFANTHSGTYNLIAAPLATITFASGTNAAAFVPLLLKPVLTNLLIPGDVLTLQRFHNGTGAVAPAVTVTVDWDCA